MSNRKNNSSNWGTENPHPLSRLKTELVWEGQMKSNLKPSVELT